VYTAVTSAARRSPRSSAAGVLAVGPRCRVESPSSVETGAAHQRRERLMLRMLGNPRQFCDGITRREALTAGALSVLGGAFNLPSLLALEQRRPASARPGKAKSVLLLYLHGGAPTHDMFDLKPSAPPHIPR